jgi:hypothetical protein
MGSLNLFFPAWLIEKPPSLNSHLKTKPIDVKISFFFFVWLECNQSYSFISPCYLIDGFLPYFSWGDEK